MKKKKISKILLIFAVIAIILGFSFVIYATEMEKTDIICNDTNLFNALKKELPSNPFISYNNTAKTISIPTEVLNNIHTLTLENAEIIDLTGLDKFVNLTELNLSKNKISSIEKLDNLNSLTKLNLSSNRTIGNSNIGNLANKTELTNLNISETGISNISFIANLIKINDLDLSNNNISNLQPLQSLHSIKVLNVSNNKNLSTLDYIKNHIELLELNISETGITYLGDTENHNGIQNLSKLEVLNVRGLNVETLSPIVDRYYSEADERDYAYLRKIKSLDISYTVGLSFGDLEILNDITDLYMLGNHINSVDGITRLSKLNYINLEENEIYDISGFIEYEMDENGNAYITKRLNAKEIVLKNNQISNINVLSYLGDIDYIDLSYNKIYQALSLEGKTLSKGLHLNNQNVELSVYKKNVNINQYIILPSLVQQTKNVNSKVYSANIEWNLEGMNLNQDQNYQSVGNYNVIIDCSKTEEDKISLTINGGVAYESIINYKVIQSGDAIDSLLFNDENLCEAIYQNLLNNKNEYSTLARAKSILNIEHDEISNINELNIAGYNIKDLTGLESFENLNKLNASENNFTTIDPLKYCVNINDLNVSNNNISNNNSAIIQMKQLKKLDLSNTGMTNIDNLNNLISLFNEFEICEIQDLNLSSNQIKNILGIEKLVELQVLHIANNEISDISKLGSLVKLKTLNISNNNIEDVSHIKNITTMRTLNISNNKIKDISQVYKGITAFYFSGNKVTDITSLSKMTSLTDLVMNNNKIEDITPIQALLINHQFSMKQQAITRIIDKDSTGNVEIELPQVLQASKTANSKVYTSQDFEVKKCTIENNKVIVNADELQDEIATVRIVGGNASETVLAISKPIKGTISYNIEELTNQDVTATITFNRSNVTITNNEGNNTYVFNKNGEFKFEFEDDNGFVGEEIATVNWIDKEAPKVTGVENGKTYPKSVTPKVTDENLSEVILTKNGIKVEDYKAGDLIEGDGKYVLTAKDGAKNVTTVSFEIKYIPTQCSISFNTKNITNQDVTATISFNKDTVTVTNNGGALKYTFKNNGSFTFKYIDESNITGEEKVEVNWIDKTAPVITGVTNNETYKESVTPIITDENLDSITLTKDGNAIEGYVSGTTLEENGNYVLTAKDKAGNITKIIFKIEKKTNMPGDINNSNNIDMGDIVSILRHITAISKSEILQEHPDWKLTNEKVEIGDVNKNGRLDMGDIVKLLRYIAASSNKNVAEKNPTWLTL